MEALDYGQDPQQGAESGGAAQTGQMSTEQLAMQQAQANLSRKPNMKMVAIKYIIAVMVLVGWVYIHFIAHIV